MQRWAQRFVIGLVFAGSLWGLCGWVLFPAASEAGRYLIFGAQYVIAVMSVAAFSWYPRAFAVFIKPLFLLMSVPWFVHNSAFAWPLLVLVIATYFVLLDYVNRSAKVLVSSLAMRYEREALLAQLVERTAEAERANVGKTRFLASASHDLRQPLQALGLLSARAVSLGESATSNHTAQLNPVLHQMRNMTRVLGDLMDALLDISRLDAGSVKPELQQFALQDVLDSVVDEAALVAADKGLSLRVWRTTVMVESDPIMLARIVRNLLANAIRYTHHGGILLATRQRGGNLNIELWDTGIGIAAADQATIFDEFVQINNPARDRSEGLGLGLAIVASLSGLLGFKISCRSRVDYGSVFTITLPHHAIAAATEPIMRQDRSMSIPRIVADELLAGAQQLLVEDDIAVNDATAMVLRSWGCMVTTALGFDEVAKIITDKSLRFDAIITDFRLRKYTGIEVANALRERYRWAIPVLVVSGEVTVDVRKEPLAEPYFLLPKPIAAAALRVALTQLLKTKVEPR